MRPASRSLSAPGPDGARVYTLYPWFEPTRPLPVPKPRAWPPPPRVKQGPYWVDPVGGVEPAYLRCTPRRGTRASKRMQARDAEQKQVQEAGLVFIAVVFVLAFAALFLSSY